MGIRVYLYVNLGFNIFGILWCSLIVYLANKQNEGATVIGNIAGIFIGILMAVWTSYLLGLF